jgi:hypothetical protein
MRQMTMRPWQRYLVHVSRIVISCLITIRVYSVFYIIG